MRKLSLILLFLFFPLLVMSQEQMERPSRGSIPEELLRPGRGGESARYPIDTVIGELGRGTASAGAFSFANSIASGLLSGLMEHPALDAINSVLRESYLSVIEVINPASVRLGGGREEADGAVSFLVRFIGREQGITGEIYIRYITRRSGDDEEEVVTTGYWAFEELLLEEAKDREVEQREAASRYDFYPYERFY